MSLRHMQRAISLLIRLPEDNRGREVTNFIKDFDLTPNEKQQVLALARDPNVVKYGRSMRGVRFEGIQAQLRLLPKFFPNDLLEYTINEYFEEIATQVRFHELAPRYLEFLLNNADVDLFLTDKVPPFFFDLVRFEREQMKFRYEVRIEKCPSKVWSRVRHFAFSVFSLEYDVLGYLQALMNGTELAESEGLSPEPRPNHILMVAKPDSPGCRYFEIDSESKHFLEAELAGITQSVPASYSQLLAMDLMK